MVLQLEARLYKTEGFRPNIEQVGVGRIDAQYNAHLVINPLQMGRPITIGMLRQEPGIPLQSASDNLELIRKVHPLSIQDNSMSLLEPSVLEKSREIYGLGSKLLDFYHNLHGLVRGILNESLAQTSNSRRVKAPGNTLAYYFTGAKEGYLYIPSKVKQDPADSTTFVPNDSFPSAVFHFEYPTYQTGDEKGMVIPFRTNNLTWEMDEGGGKRRAIERKYRRHSGMWISASDAGGLMAFPEFVKEVQSELERVLEEFLAEREVQQKLLAMYPDLAFR